MGEIIEEVKDLLRRAPLPPEDTLPPGASEAALSAFEQRVAIELPGDLRDFLRLTNGPCVGPGGLMGIEPSRKTLGIEFILGLFPSWKEKGWIPIAGDGCGNYYLVVTRGDFGRGEPVIFVEPMEDDESPAFVVGSDVWRFVRFLLKKELGESNWPFRQEEVLGADPKIAEFTGVPMPWEA